MELEQKRPPDFIQPGDGIPIHPRKRFKASELPLTQAQRTSIESILHSFKKKGEFDVIRKKVFAQFQNSNAKSELLQSLATLAESELERNPSLMAKDRKQAAPLIEGAAERSEIYKAAEVDIDRIIDEFIGEAEQKLRDIRKAEVGIENTAEEQTRGSKSDEQYALESIARRQVWAKAREEENEKQRQKELEEERRREDERKRKQAEEEERERQREIEREKEKKRQEEWERELEERRERKKRQDAEWEKERLEKEEQARKKREADREKEIEAAALEELLRESKRSITKPIRAEDTQPKESGAKESALAAIMKAEKLERERAKNGDSAGEATESSKEQSKEATASGQFSPLDPRSPNGYLYKSNVWVRDGQKSKYTAHKRESVENVEREFISDKPRKPFPHEDTTAPEGGSKNSSSYREERTKDRSHHGTFDGSGEKSLSVERRGSHGAPERRSSTTDRTDHRYYKSPKEIYRSSHNRDKYGRSRSPSAQDLHRHRTLDGTVEDRRESRRYHETSRSRSPHRHRSAYRERDRKDSSTRSPSRTHRRSRSRDPKDIDRYVPPSSHHDKDEDRTHERYTRNRGRDSGHTGAKDGDRNSRGYDKHQDPSSGYDKDKRRESIRERERERHRSVSRHRDRARERDGGRAQERDSEATAAPVQIDRYMPSTSYRAQRGELDAPAHARTHALAGSQKPIKRSNSRDESRSRSRSPKESRSRSYKDDGRSRSQSRNRRR